MSQNNIGNKGMKYKHYSLHLTKRNLNRNLGTPRCQWPKWSKSQQFTK